MFTSDPEFLWELPSGDGYCKSLVELKVIAMENDKIVYQCISFIIGNKQAWKWDNNLIETEWNWNWWCLIQILDHYLGWAYPYYGDDMEGLIHLILNFGGVTTSKFRMFTSNQSSNLAGNFGGAADWLWKNTHRYETLFETHVSQKTILGTSPEVGRRFLDPQRFTTFFFIMTSPRPVDFSPFIPASEVIERSRMVFTENSVGFCCIRAVKCSAALKAMNFGRWTSN